MSHELAPSFPSYKLLSDNGYAFVEQVRDASDAALVSIKGIGPKALEEIRAAQAEILAQVPLFELEPDAAPVAPVEPEPEPEVAPVLETVRVTVNVGRLYHDGRFYTRGDTVVIPVAAASALRAQDHVRY